MTGDKYNYISMHEWMTEDRYNCINMSEWQKTSEYKCLNMHDWLTSTIVWMYIIEWHDDMTSISEWGDKGV